MASNLPYLNADIYLLFYPRRAAQKIALPHLDPRIRSSAARPNVFAVRWFSGGLPSNGNFTWGVKFSRHMQGRQFEGAAVGYNGQRQHWLHLVFLARRARGRRADRYAASAPRLSATNSGPLAPIR